MQSVSSRIWTRVAVSISYDDNDYTTWLSSLKMGMETCVQNLDEAICISLGANTLR